MAFLQIEQWETGIAPRARAAPLPSRSRQKKRPSVRWSASQPLWRQCLSLTIALLLHALILYVLINRVFGSSGLALSTGTGGEAVELLAFVGSGDSQDLKDEASQQLVEAPPPPPEPTSEVVEKPIPPEDNAGIKPSSDVSSAVPHSATGAAPNGYTGGSPGGGYDPFAGAAPLQTNGAVAAAGGIGPLAQSASPEAADPFRLDQDAFEAIRRQIATRFKSSSGSLEFMVRVLPDGTVVQVQPIGGSAPAPVTAAFAAALTGKALFLISVAVTEAQWRTLPTIQVP